MKTKLKVAVFGMIIAVTAGMAGACVRDVPEKAHKVIEPAQRINQDLFDMAVRAEVNFHRCRAGLPKLQDAGDALAREARTHSTWMARQQTLSHTNSIPGKRSLSDRVQASGVRFRIGSENVGMVQRYQLGNQRFRIVDSATCTFAATNGQRLPPHSYASLARHAVTLWMNSPNHRVNILDRRATRLATAIAFDPKSQFCGSFYVTQNFVG